MLLVVVSARTIFHLFNFPILVQEYDTPLTTRDARSFVHFVPCIWGAFAASTGTATAITANIARTDVALRKCVRTFLLYQERYQPSKAQTELCKSLQDACMSKIHTIFEGTSEIQQLVIARAISGLRVE